MLKTYKYRLYPNPKQQAVLLKHFGCVRYVYNWALAKKIEVYQQNKKRISCFDLIKKMKKLKDDKQWLMEVNSQSLQASINNLGVLL